MEKIGKYSGKLDVYRTLKHINMMEKMTKKSKKCGVEKEEKFKILSLYDVVTYAEEREIQH